MRLASILPLLGAATTVLGHAKRDKPAKATTFNGVEVPPLLELTDKNHSTEANATTLMMVKYYRYVMARAVWPRPQSLTGPAQPVLSSLHRFRAHLPDGVRVLLHLKA
jgi:hypothetical protein